MKKLLIAALGLMAAVAFTAPAFEASSALATTVGTAATQAGTAATNAATKTVKKATHHAACKPTKTHKCPPVHHTKKKPATPTGY